MEWPIHLQYEKQGAADGHRAHEEHRDNRCISRGQQAIAYERDRQPEQHDHKKKPLRLTVHCRQTTSHLASSKLFGSFPRTEPEATAESHRAE